MANSEPLPQNQSAARGAKLSFERERGVYALQVTRDVAHTVAPLPAGEGGRTDGILRLFRLLADAEIPIFLIKLHQNAVTFALAGIHADKAGEILSQNSFPVKVRRDLVMLTVIAASMREVSGVMTDMADALYDAEARLFETGDSHDSVHCLIEALRAGAATEKLCAVFGLSPDAVEEHSLYEESLL